jgi:hypothetical protein
MTKDRDALLALLREVTGLAAGLADDDPYYAEQRGADAILERARAALSALAPAESEWTTRQLHDALLVAAHLGRTDAHPDVLAAFERLSPPAPAVERQGRECPTCGGAGRLTEFVPK